MPSIATQNLTVMDVSPLPAVPFNERSKSNFVPLTVKLKTVFE